MLSEINDDDDDKITVLEHASRGLSAIAELLVNVCAVFTCNCDIVGLC